MNTRSLTVKLVSLCLLAAMLMGLYPAVTYAQPPSLHLNRHSYHPGEEIEVRFTAPHDFNANAWVGIIPSDVPHGSEALNDRHDIAYQYLNKRTRGTLIFRAPSRPGSYDFRMNSSDNRGREVCYVTFQVEPERRHGYGRAHQAELYLEKNHYRPGETIRLNFKAPGNLPDNAWIGIIPSYIPHGSEARNDRNDITFQYIRGRTQGVMTFTAPRKPGSYDFRMHDSDNNGREIESVTFRVGH